MIASGFTLPPTPATSSNRYETLGSYTTVNGAATVEPMQQAPAGSVQLEVDAATRSYTLTVTAGIHAWPKVTFALPANSPLGTSANNPPVGIGCTDPAVCQAEARKYRMFAPLSTSATAITRGLLELYNVGQLNGSPRHVSAGWWAIGNLENPNGDGISSKFRLKEETSGLFVFGPRTERSDMPATGSARYELISLNRFSDRSDENEIPIDIDGDTVLEIDFATRELFATYDLALSGPLYRLDDHGSFVTDEQGYAINDGRYSTVVHARGNTVVGGDNAFTLSLSGTGSVHTERTDLTPVADVVKPVTGEITGAFFGPQAAEVGGIRTLPMINEGGIVTSFVDAFAGMRSVP